VELCKQYSTSGGCIFSYNSHGMKCTPISYFAVLYSSVVDIDSWTPQTVDFVLFQGDSMYNCVRHEHLHFDYNELTRRDSDRILSSTYHCHRSGFLHCTESSEQFECFVDAVSDVCRHSPGCLVTATSITVAVIRRNNFVFNSHAHNRLGLPDARGTAVLLKFSSLEAVYYHMKQLHSIAADVGACRAKWQLGHDHHCQFDVVGVAVDSLFDNERVSTCVVGVSVSAAASMSFACPYLYSSVVSAVVIQVCIRAIQYHSLT